MSDSKVPEPQIPIFHPVHMRDSDAWFPGNDAAALMIHISHAYEDTLRVLELRRQQEDEYTKRLLLKYAVVEVREMLPLMSRLQTEVMSFPVVEDDEYYPWRAVTKSQLAECKTLFKSFNRSKAECEKQLVEIRNRIGAHRSVDPWDEVMRAWDELSPELITPLANAIASAFNFVAGLDIFDWTRCPGGPDSDAIEILGGRIDWVGDRHA